MKKFILYFTLIGFSFLQKADEKLNIDTTKSTIHWEGYYLFHFSSHDGNIQFKKGHFIKTGDLITGGEFVIDMNSMTNNDLENDKAKASLIDHLKDPDFFDVANYPEAKLVFTKVEYNSPTRMQIHADLTIKGKTNPINFQATVDFEKQQMTTKFKIDRMLWGISYKSKVRDGAISDAIGFEATLVLD